MSEPEISIVLPILDEAGSIETLYERLVAAAEKVGLEYEILFIDDGSNDTTWEIISSLSKSDPRVRGFQLSRNFGHQAAVGAGLALSPSPVSRFRPPRRHCSAAI